MSNIMKFAQPVRVGNFASSPADVSAGAIYFNTGDQGLYYSDGSAYIQLSSSTSSANRTLSNLTSPTAINQDLIADSDDTRSLGEAATTWANIYVGLLKDSSDVTAVSITGRALVDTAAASQLTWSTSGVALPQLTATTVPYLNGSKVLTSSAVTPTELGYVSGVTSAIQTQLNAKANDNIVIKKDGSVTYTANQPMGSFKLTGLSAGTTAGDSVRYEQVILRDGSQAFTATQSLGGFKLTNVADPVSAQDAATKNYVDSLQYGLSWKQAVRAASTADVDTSTDLEDGDTLDGVTLATGDRVLLKNQTATEENGIYVVPASGAATRSADMNTWSEVPAAACFIEEGTVNADTAYVCTSDQGGTINVDPITFVLFASTTSFVAGNGIDIAGNVISVKTDGEGLTFSSTNLALELDGSTLSKSASGLKVATGGITNTEVNAAAAIAYSKLALSNSIVNADINSAAAIAYSKLNLTGSIVNADINASAAIAYSKLNLSASIVNADIASGAAIAYSKLALTASIVNADIAAAAAIAYNKLAALTASRALQSDGSGFVSVSAVTSTELGYVSGVTSAIQTQIDTKVTGPASATDNALARYDGASGKLVQDSNASLSDSGALTIQDTFSRGDNSASNVVEEEYVHNATLTASTTAVLSNLTFDGRAYKALQVDYMVKNGNDRRTGTLQVVCNNASAVAPSTTSITDQSTETADINLTWSAAVNGNNVEISYTTSSGTYRINADLKRFMAN